MFDEAAALFGAMGRYCNGNKEYDRALYNTLWNCPALYSRDNSNYMLRLIDPRFNMAFATHADATLKLLASNMPKSTNFNFKLNIYFNIRKIEKNKRLPFLFLNIIGFILSLKIHQKLILICLKNVNMGLNHLVLFT